MIQATKPMQIMKKLVNVMVALWLGILGGSAYGQKLDQLCPDKGKPPCSTAKNMLVSAWTIVTGDKFADPTGTGWQVDAERMLQFGIVSEEKFKQGIKLPDAVNYYKFYISTLSPGHGSQAIDRAFQEVYGRFPEVAEKQAWQAKVTAKTAWYTAIVVAEQGNFMKNTAEKTATIERAFNRAIVRKPTAEELKKWLGSSQHYRQLVGELRAWLYSPAGVEELRKVVRIALYPKLKKEPTEAQKDAAITVYKPLKLIYTEMIEYNKTCGANCGF
jgi:hypothetical protein